MYFIVRVSWNNHFTTIDFQVKIRFKERKTVFWISKQAGYRKPFKEYMFNINTGGKEYEKAIKANQKLLVVNKKHFLIFSFICLASLLNPVRKTLTGLQNRDFH